MFRFILGEGIEKKQADLAKDVEEQTNKMKEEAAAKAAAAKDQPEALPEPSDEEVAAMKVNSTCRFILNLDIIFACFWYQHSWHWSSGQ